MSNYKHCQILRMIFLFCEVKDGYHINALVEKQEENEMFEIDKIQAESTSKG